jgi:hypothetical protein
MKKLIAILLVGSALAWIQPVLAQSNYGSDAQISTDSNAVPPLGESWDVGPSSLADPALAPAPEEPMGTESAPMFGGLTPAPSAGPWMQRPEGPFAQPFVNPTIPATGMSELPPEGAFHGGFGRPIH